ncbi:MULTISPECIES: transporter substrate-binding domain-containing protein [Agrobacterium]|uniref:Polar amino acid transport system substrate-binding protein n=1 Tax=Agrobacterium tumefaciens TaxID=358 RepID=A0AAW8M2D6_AGRTU|nr:MULTISPECIES: transporter substrate-binding domain-containing protein [Agrobacterium]MBP2511511.1 polar amino acid transport system substrate-binding protein [Agrobacterium tumefaciens]MBP2520774.1 polar amino acid transport system substrate-binding protein [Agrobacterium tumefaciens]MBP2537517.1 polar amino acid transport system substrate-binding protein [Agrobacterium tumefaciens]MBP2568674.1 polar amino acid transport system substrate-binding protein [Agrobacterium tumefaciens]MBP2574042
MNRRDFGSLLGLAGAGAVATALAAPALAQAPAAGSTFERIRSSKKLRVAGIVGTEPYYHKDIATGEWSGFCMSMARDLAKSLEAEVEISETTWGNAVLDLQANKIDIMFGLSPTPSRALVVEFTRPIMQNTFTIIAKPGLEPKTWEELNKPEIRIAVDIGSTHDLFARRVLPKATLVALKTPDEATLSVQTGRADAVIQVAMLSLVTVKKNANVGKIVVPGPIVRQPTCAGVRAEDSSRFRTFVDNWLEFNRSSGVVTSWITSSLDLVGVQKEDIPADIQF